MRAGGRYEAGSKQSVAYSRSRLNKCIVPEGPRVGVCGCVGFVVAGEGAGMGGGGVLRGQGGDLQRIDSPLRPSLRPRLFSVFERPVLSK